MLIINKKETPIEEVAQMFDVPLKKLRRPEFDINKERVNTKKIGQSKELCIPAGTRVPAVFTVKHKGMMMEIRYAEGITPKQVGDKMIDEYHPLKVMFKGESMLLDTLEEDLAVYMYLHPLNETSPFRSQVNEKFHWSFKDLERRGHIQMSQVNDLRDALNLVADLKGAQLKVVAKGMGIPVPEGQADIITQAELSRLAQSNPTVFVNNIDRKDVLFKGLVFDGVDTGLFTLENGRGGKRWVWGAGPQKGETIVDVVSAVLPENDVLLQHVMSKIETYYGKILNAHKIVNAEKTATAFLDSQDFDLNSLFNSNDDEGTSTPDNSAASPSGSAPFIPSESSKKSTPADDLGIGGGTDDDEEDFNLSDEDADDDGQGSESSEDEDDDIPAFLKPAAKAASKGKGKK